MASDSSIVAKSLILSKISHDYAFYPKKLLIVNDENVGKLGELDYENPLYEVKCGVRLGDFFFCLERKTSLGIKITGPPNIPNRWVVGAFRNEFHYQFTNLEDNEDLEDIYFKYLIENIAILIYPELNLKDYTFEITEI